MRSTFSSAIDQFVFAANKMNRFGHVQLIAFHFSAELIAFCLRSLYEKINDSIFSPSPPLSPPPYPSPSNACQSIWKQMCRMLVLQLNLSLAFKLSVKKYASNAKRMRNNKYQMDFLCHAKSLSRDGWYACHDNSKTLSAEAPIYFKTFKLK